MHLALSTDGTNPKYPNTNVYLFDEQTKQGKYHTFQLFDVVRNIRLVKDYLVVQTKNIILFDLNSPKKESRLLIDNKSISQQLLYDLYTIPTQTLYFAHTTTEPGFISIQDLSYEDLEEDSYKVSNQRITQMRFSNDGRYLACVKDQAISIKIFDSEKESVVQDLIRGMKKGGIYDLAWSHDDRYLAVLSHSLTLHIFEMASAKATLKA